MNNQKYYNLTWQDIDNFCINIKDQIVQTNYKPDTIICIGRGGMIPSRILSDLLDIKDICMMNIKLYKGINIRNIEPKIENFNYILEGRLVLLVDDIYDTGITLNFALKTIKDKKIKDSRCATLLCKEQSEKPSFYAEQCKKDEWVVFPWENNETRKGG